jgi:hypothetical protein
MQFMCAASLLTTTENLKGLWTRSLIVWPDGKRDETTQVWWLQGPDFYADLRQPRGAPHFDGVHRLADVTPAQLTWMATQEAFAGELRFDGGACFEWQRGIDLQPRGAYADRGLLWFEADVLIERGVHVDYVEHWHRRSKPAQHFAAARLSSDDGRRGYLVRVDTVFMYARGTERVLAPNTSLSECVQAAPSHGAASRLLDFEVALGRISTAGWVIERSSLPFRSGQRFDLRSCDDHRLITTDSDFDVGTRERVWAIDELRGSLADVVVNI